MDTNVLVHTQSRESPYFLDAVRFVGALLATKTALCLDQEFDLDNEGQPGSLIGAEYLKHLQPQTYGFIALAALLASGRFKAVGTKVSDQARKWADQQIPKKRDRTFFRVALLSDEKILVSHDEDDFSPDVRRRAQKEFSVEICTAAVAQPKLQP